MAVSNSGIARILDEDAADSTGSRFGSKKATSSTSRMYANGYAADEARNRAAGEALELYFKLAAAESGIAISRAAEQDLVPLLDASRKAVAAGFKEPADRVELALQLADVRGEAARLKGAAAELNVALKALLGLPLAPDYRLWPDAPEVREYPIDVEDAVRVGHRYRPDLLLLRSLALSADKNAPSVGKQVLGGLNPLASGPPSIPSGSGPALKLLASCIGLGVPGAEQDARTQRQIADLASDRERQAEGEIRAAADRVAALATQARVHADVVDELQNRMAELEAAKATGRDVAAPLAIAKAAYRKASGNLLKSATDYQTAVARLKQAQGLLVRDPSNPELPLVAPQR